MTVSKPQTQVQGPSFDLPDSPKMSLDVSAPFVWGGGCTQLSASGALQALAGKVPVGYRVLHCQVGPLDPL